MGSSFAMKTAFSCVNTLASRTTQKLYLSEDFADFHFRFVEGGVRKSIPAHRAILATSSDVFAAMLSGQWEERSEAVIVDASFDVFKEFLQFLYLSRVKVLTENLGEVLHLADKYNVRECAETIGQQLPMNEICTVLDLATEYDLFDVKAICLARISKETTKILATDELLHCSQLTLKTILELDAIECFEIDMFNAAIRWAQHACDAKKKDPTIVANIKEELGDCLYAIRFGVMSPDEIALCDEFYMPMETHLFKNVGRTTQWCGAREFICDLGSAYVGKTLLERVESTTFQVNRPLLFGGIRYGSNIYNSENAIRAELTVFEITANGLYVKILQQNCPCGYVKFMTPFRIKPNTEYEIRIEPEMELCYCFDDTIGPNREKNIGSGIVVQTMDKCSRFIKTLFFNH